MPDMDAKTLEALRGSIRKWELIELQGGQDEGGLNCPLCARFLWKGCWGCPVNDFTKTKENGKMCETTPFREWYNHHEDANHRYSKRVCQCAECVRLARAEKEFLIGLLPEGEENGSD